MTVGFLPAHLWEWALAIYQCATLEQEIAEHEATCAACRELEAPCFISERHRRRVTFHRGVIAGIEARDARARVIGGDPRPGGALPA